MPQCLRTTIYILMTRVYVSPKNNKHPARTGWTILLLGGFSLEVLTGVL